jgi:hypothetical protein
MALGTTLVNLAEGFVQRHRHEITVASSSMRAGDTPAYGSAVSAPAAGLHRGAATQAAARLRAASLVPEPAASAAKSASASVQLSAFVDSCLPDVDESDSDEEAVIVDDSSDEDEDGQCGGGGSGGGEAMADAEDGWAQPQQLEMDAVEIGFDEIGSQSLDSLSSTVRLDSLGSTVRLDSRLGSPNDEISARHAGNQVAQSRPLHARLGPVASVPCEVASQVFRANSGRSGVCSLIGISRPASPPRSPRWRSTVTAMRMRRTTRASGR